MYFILHHNRKSLLSGCIFNSDVNFDCLRLCRSGFSMERVTFFPFVVSK